MSNYCNGTATVTGKAETIEKLYDALRLLDDGLSDVTGYDGDSDWMGHIFKGGEHCIDGVFEEGRGFINDGELEIYYRARNSDGIEFFEFMAEGLGVVIELDYVDDCDDKSYKKKIIPKTDTATLELYSEEDMDGDDDDDDDSVRTAGGPLTFGGVQAPVQDAFGGGIKPMGLSWSTTPRPPVTTSGCTSRVQQLTMALQSAKTVDLLFKGVQQQEDYNFLKVAACMHTLSFMKAVDSYIRDDPNTFAMLGAGGSDSIFTLRNNITSFERALSIAVTGFQPFGWYIPYDEVNINYSVCQRAFLLAVDLCSKMKETVWEFTVIEKCSVPDKGWN